MLLKKGQAALEFLTTYGWAFMVILAMIGSLSYFGVLDPTSFISDRCVVASPFTCEEFLVGDGGFMIKLYNGFHQPLVISQFEYQSDSGFTSCNIGSLTIGASSRATIQCPTSGELSGQLNFRFRYNSLTDQSGSFTRTISGNINARIQSEDVLSPFASSLQYLFDISSSSLGGATTITYHSDHVYVGAYTDDSFTVFDVSNPSSPIQVAYEETDIRRPHSIRLQNNIMYIVNFWSPRYFATYDVSDPSNPIRLDGIIDSNINPLDMFVSGNIVYVVGQHSIGAMDVSNPSNLNYLEVLRDTTYLNTATDLVVDGNYAYISSRNPGSLTIVDVSNPSDMSIVSNFLDHSYTGYWGIEKIGDYLLVAAEGTSNLLVFDVSDVNNPDLVNVISQNLDRPRDIFLYQNRLFVTNTNSNFISIFDVSNPSSPEFLNVFEHPSLSGVRYLVANNGFLYAASMGSNSFTVLEME